MSGAGWVPSAPIVHTWRTPARSVTKTMRLPAGENRGSWFSEELWVRIPLADPCGLIDQIWACALVTPLLDSIVDPSGDQAGSCPGGIAAAVRTVGGPPETSQVSITVV